MTTDAVEPDQERTALWARHVAAEYPGAYAISHTRPDGQRVRIVTGSKAAAEAAAITFAAIDAQAQADRRSRGSFDLETELQHACVALSRLLSGHDALYVISKLERHMTPSDLATWSESSTALDASWVCVDVVALWLLGADLPPRSAPATTVSGLLPDLIEAASEVVDLAEVSTAASRWRPSTGLEVDFALNEMASSMRAWATFVTGHQYQTISEQIHNVTLRRPNADAVWSRVLGFTFGDVLSVRAALVGILRAEHTAELESIAGAAFARLEHDAAVAETIERSSLIPFARVVTTDQAAARAGLRPEVAERVLDLFSIAPDGRTSLELLQEFVAGRNPKAGKDIIKVPGRGYLVGYRVIDPAQIRRAAEARIARDPAWTKYGKGRDDAVEALVASTFHRMVRNRGVMHRQLRYRAAPRPGQTADLSSVSTDAGRADSAEADALLVLDGVALCIEVKAGSISAPSRQGSVKRLHRDLKAIIQKASTQADRLRSLVTTHHGIWLDDGTWLDLSDVQEVYSLVVTLDDIGPAALDVVALLRSGVLTQRNLPWIVSVHDLLVVADLFDRPEQLLAYLRRRTDRDAALLATGGDELDIVMWFVQGGFNFQPDPDRLHHAHPGGRPPTTKQRRAYAEQGRTIVGTFTDPLDAWYHYREGISSAPTERPTRGMNQFVRRIVDQITEQGGPGWWRACADLDGYSAGGQQVIASQAQQLLRMSAEDDKVHTLATGDIGSSGRWVFIFATGPDTARNREKLCRYLRAKKHSEHADRAMAILLGPDGAVRTTQWIAHPPAADLELDQLTRELRLVPPDRVPRAIPPRAKPGAKRPAHRRRRRR